jgi:hypothetical protein
MYIADIYVRVSQCGSQATAARARHRYGSRKLSLKRIMKFKAWPQSAFSKDFIEKGDSYQPEKQPALVKRTETRNH